MKSSSRFPVLPSLFLVCAAAAICAAPAVAQTDPVTPGGVTVTLTKVATVNVAAFGTPQDIVTAPGDASDLFITTRNGDVLTMHNGAISTTPLLSFANAGISVYTGGEGGLLGMAFSPGFATQGSFGFGKFYTVDTEAFSTSGPAADFSSPELFPTTGTAPNNQIVVREWTETNGVVGSTSRVLMRIDHPQSNHQGGSLRFGPDGELYLGLGDGGGGNDLNGSAGSATDGHNNAIGNGQDKTVPFGKILRIDPNPAAGAGFTLSANGQYSIPVSNPFSSTGGGALKEIFAYGLRNPYRISFDSSSGLLYAADVGQNNREEVDTILNGGNYGWPFREGTRDNSADAGRTTPGGFTSTAPIGEYTHADGAAIIGGIVYHGADVPALDGDYLFGDLTGTTGNGRLFYMSATGGAVHELSFAAGSAPISSNFYGVSADSAGEPFYFFSDGSILTVPEPATGVIVGWTLAGAGLLRFRRKLVKP